MLDEFGEPIGLSVTLSGLKNDYFNGRAGVIDGRVSDDNKRFAVLLDGSDAGSEDKGKHRFFMQDQDIDADMHNFHPFLLEDSEFDRILCASRRLY